MNLYFDINANFIDNSLNRENLKKHATYTYTLR